MDIESLQPWCDKPVMVQLRIPVILAIASRDEKLEWVRVKVGEREYGQPTPLTQPTQQGPMPEASNVLLGVISISGEPNVKRVVMKTKFKAGETIEVAIQPELIDYISVITELPENTRLIQ